MFQLMVCVIMHTIYNKSSDECSVYRIKRKDADRLGKTEKGDGSIETRGSEVVIY